MLRPMCTLLLLLSAACDVQNAAGAADASAGIVRNAGAADAAAARDEQPPSEQVDPATAVGGAGPVKFDSLSDCRKICEGGDMIPTNRATCRLNCESGHGAQSPGTADGGVDPVDEAAKCFGRCYAADASADDCANSCKTMASKAPTPPTAQVLDRLGICVRTCHADRSLTPTNRATCELYCTQAAHRVRPSPPTAR